MTIFRAVSGRVATTFAKRASSNISSVNIYPASSDEVNGCRTSIDQLALYFFPTSWWICRRVFRLFDQVMSMTRFWEKPIVLPRNTLPTRTWFLVADILQEVPTNWLSDGRYWVERTRDNALNKYGSSPAYEKRPVTGSITTTTFTRFSINL